MIVSIPASIAYVDAEKAEGVYMLETMSKKVCGDRLCSEIDTSKSAKPMIKDQVKESKMIQNQDNKAKHEQKMTQSMTKEHSTHEQKSDHKPKIELHANQKMIGHYKITVDWLNTFPISEHSNGVQVLVADTSIQPEHGMKGMSEKHGESSHEGKEKHGDKGGMGGADCRCIQMIKNSNLRAELSENGVSNLQNSLKLKIMFGEDSIDLPLKQAAYPPGFYYAQFVPSASGQYQFQIGGSINGMPINELYTPEKVIESSSLMMFP